MSFKKIMQSNKVYVIGQSEDLTSMFLPGFRYRIGETIYTVIRDVTQDDTANMREVVTSSGGTEIMSVEVIQRDLKEWNAQVLEPDQKYAKKEPEKNVSKEEVVKEDGKKEEKAN